MINREQQTVQVVTFSSGVDSYGQTRTTQSSTRDIKALVKTYSNQNVNNPKFNDCTLIALTKDSSVDVTNQIKISTDYYDILYIIPSSRYNQLFLREVK